MYYTIFCKFPLVRVGSNDWKTMGVGVTLIYTASNNTPSTIDCINIETLLTLYLRVTSEQIVKLTTDICLYLTWRYNVGKSEIYNLKNLKRRPSDYELLVVYSIIAVCNSFLMSTKLGRSRWTDLSRQSVRLCNH